MSEDSRRAFVPSPSGRARAESRDALLPVLRAVQTASHGYLDDRLLGAIADHRGISDARVRGVASFYSLLSLHPRGEKRIRLCDGPGCWLKKAEAIGDAVRAEGSKKRLVDRALQLSRIVRSRAGGAQLCIRESLRIKYSRTALRTAP